MLIWKIIREYLFRVFTYNFIFLGITRFNQSFLNLRNTLVWDDDVELSFLGRSGRFGAVSSLSSIDAAWVITGDGRLIALGRIST